MSDFSAFGGWTNPHAKQYQGDVTMCRCVYSLTALRVTFIDIIIYYSTGVDKNYSPYDVTAEEEQPPQQEE